MDGTRVTVQCRNCSLAATYDDRLRDARTAVDDHESTTGHDVRWEIESLDAGVSSRRRAQTQASAVVRVRERGLAARRPGTAGTRVVAETPSEPSSEPSLGLSTTSPPNP